MSTDGACYLLDTNGFIKAHRRYYAFSICPGFWDALIWHHAEGAWRSIDLVREELLEGKDDLASWVANAVRREAFCSTNEPDVARWYGEVMRWVLARPQYTDEAKDQFARDPDAWLIAYAKAREWTIVTHEGSHADSRSKVFIPNVCQAFGMRPVDSFVMLHLMDARFEWRPPA